MAASPPSAAPLALPPSPPQAVVLYTVIASGTIDDYTPQLQSAMREAVAIAAGVDLSYVALTITAASVSLQFTIITPPSASSDGLESNLSRSMGTSADASSALGIRVESAAVRVTTYSAASNLPVGEAQTRVIADVVNEEASLGNDTLIAIVVGPTVVVLCLLAGLIYCCMRRHGSLCLPWRRRRLQSTSIFSLKAVP